MEYMLFGFMALLLLYTGYRNVTLLKRYKKNQEYIECYKAILRGDENAYERISAFIDSQKDPEFAGKARFLKLYVELDKKLPYQETLNAINLKDVFYKKDIYPLTVTEFEGEMFPVPLDMDAYLTNVYGDWRKLPSEESIKKAIHCTEYRDEIFGKGQ